jgi:hypothetical protein
LLSRYIDQQSGGRHPARLIACVLGGERARLSADQISPGLGSSSRPPIVIRDYLNRFGLILTRARDGGGEEYRYLVLKSFVQDADGSVHGAVSDDDRDDPLGYAPVLQRGAPGLESNWLSDREWLSLASSTDMPTAVFTIEKNLILAPRLASDSALQRESPDFIVFANRGFSFDNDGEESDHGGLFVEETRNSLFISGLGSARPGLAAKAKGQAMTRDVTPTVLEAAGKPVQIPGSRGESLYGRYLEILGTGN